MKIFLDDVRDPRNCLGYMYRRIGASNVLYQEEWTVVRNYLDFARTLFENIDIVTHVSFDHDLGEDIAVIARECGMSKRKARSLKKECKDGNECAKYLMKLYREQEKELPQLFIHSMNPVGTERIAATLGLRQNFAW